MAGWKWINPQQKRQQESGFFSNIVADMRARGIIPDPKPYSLPGFDSPWPKAWEPPAAEEPEGGAFTPNPQYSEAPGSMPISGNLTPTDILTPDTATPWWHQVLNDTRHLWSDQEGAGMTVANARDLGGDLWRPVGSVLDTGRPYVEGAVLAPFGRADPQTGQLSYDVENTLNTVRHPSNFTDGLNANPWDPQNWNALEQRGQAFDESNVPTWAKVPLQMLSTPSSYMGAGLLKGGVKGGVMLGASALGAGGAAQAGETLNAPEWLQPFLPVAGGVAGGLSAHGGVKITQALSRGGAESPAFVPPGMDAEGLVYHNSGVGPGAVSAAARLAAAPGDLIAHIYGQLPFLKDTGFGGQPDWFTEAPDAYGGASRYLPLKELLQGDALPVSAKISDTLWKVMERVSDVTFGKRVHDPRTVQIVEAYNLNDRAIPGIADALSMAHSDALRDLPVGPTGEALVDGKSVPKKTRPSGILEADAKGGQKTATWDDIVRDPALYPDAAVKLTPQQWDAYRQQAAVLDDLRKTNDAMGIKSEKPVEIGPGGVFATRVGTKPMGQAEGPTTSLGPRTKGTKAGATQGRQFESGADAIANGYQVPHPVDAFHRAVTEMLQQQNAAHAGNLLKGVLLDDGKTVGEGTVPQAVRDERAQLRSELKPQKAEMRELKTRWGVSARDVRLGQSWLGPAYQRFTEYAAKASDATAAIAERKAAAGQALEAAKQQLGDSLSAARELEAKTAALGGEKAASRIALKGVLDQGAEMSKRLDAIAAQLTEDLAHPPAAMAKEAKAAIDYAAQVRKAAGAEASRLGKKLGNLPIEDVAARHADAVEAVADAHARFRASMSEAERASADAQASAASGQATYARAREALWKGKAAELSQIYRQRASQVAAAVGRQTELGEKINELADRMEPTQQRARELRLQAEATRKLARDRQMRYGAPDVGLDNMQGVPVDRMISNTMNHALARSREVGALAGFYDLFNNVYRMMGATLDMSRLGTVGLLGEAANPGLSTRAFGTGVKAMIKGPDVYRERARQINAAAVRDGLPSVAEAIGRDGLQLVGSEEAIVPGQSGSAAQKWIASRPGIRHSELLFSVPGNVERMERYYKLLREAKADGRDYTSNTAREGMANAANLTSGRATTSVLSPVIGNEAANRIFFAGRFMQSQIETVMNATLSGGIEGDVARQALARVTTGVALATVGANYLLGNQTVFDPGDSKFMAIRLGDSYYKLGGPWQTLLTGTWKTMHEAGDSAASGDALGVLTSPSGFARNKMAPVPAQLYDETFGHGKDPGGNSANSPTRLIPTPFGLGDVGKQAGQADMSPESIVSTAGASIASLAGVRVNPLSPVERLDDDARSMVPGAKDYYSISNTDKRRVQLAHPDDFSAYSENQGENTQKYNAQKADFIADQVKSDEKLRARTITKKAWADDYHDRVQKLSGQAALLFPDKIKNPQDAEQRYQQQIEQSKAGNAGIPDWNKVDAWVAAQPSSDQKYIDDHAALPWTPLIGELKAAQKVRQQYYDLPKYVGFSGDDAQAIDRVMATVKSALPPKAPVSLQMQALSKFGADLTPRQKQGALAAVYGTLKPVGVRPQFAKLHPELAEFFGPGDYTGP